MKTALIAGATGLIGQQLLQLLLQNDQYEKVKAITRKPLEFNHPKLINIVIDFETLSDHAEDLKADDVFCCLGTTMKQAKTKEAFKKVDFDYPLRLAAIAKVQNAAHYMLVSALGANKDSAIYYNKIKGELEQSITNLCLDSLHIFRPSLLLGNRKDARSGEDAAKVFYKIFGFMIPAKYKGIDSLRVAKAMLAFANDNKPGTFIHESIDLQKF